MTIELESPFPLLHVPRIWTWVQKFRDKVADDFAPKTLDEFVDDWERKEQHGQRSWAVKRDGERGGVIQSEAISPGVRSIHALFKPEFWGDQTTLPAIALACKELFQGDTRKLVALMFVDNIAAIHMAMRLGGIREGTLIAETIRGGQPVNVAIIGIHREGFDYGRISQRRLPKFEHKRKLHKHGDDGPAGANGRHGVDGENTNPVPTEPTKPAVLVRVDAPIEPDLGNGADSGAEPRPDERNVQRSSRQPAATVR